MKLSSISFNDKTAPDYQPAGLFPPNTNRASDNTYSPRIAAIWKDAPGQAANALAQEMRNPLCHIKLSVEMLESIIEDKDLKIYLDVIMRNSIRIDNLLHEFLRENK